MKKLLMKFRGEPTNIKLAKRIVDYAGRHPMATCMLSESFISTFNSAYVLQAVV